MTPNVGLGYFKPRRSAQSISKCCLFIILLAANCQLQSAKMHSNGRVRDIKNLARIYREQHSIFALRNESTEDLCARKFVSNEYGRISCDWMGNSLGYFLSNAMVSVAFNRTLLAHNWDPSSCVGLLSLRKWVPSVTEVKLLLKKANCSLDLYHVPTRLFIDKMPCDFSNIEERYISYNELMNPAYSRLWINKPNSSHVQPWVVDRLAIMFESPLSDLGRFEFYGVMSFEIFYFEHAVHQSVASILKTTSVSNSVKLSVHLRHQNTASLADPSLDTLYDDGAMQALFELRNQTRDLRCFVFIATDRNVSLDRVEAYSREIGCTPYHVPRSSGTTVFKNEYPEHGPWARGLLQLADLYLLSHGDYFIASAFSSYSFLIANNIAAKSFHGGHNLYPFTWLGYNGVSYSTSYFVNAPEVLGCNYE
jgi:hypothetical protein